MCVGASFQVVVTVNPKPVIFNYAPTDICSGGTFTAVLPTNGIPLATTIVPAGTTYTWGIPIMTSGVAGGTAAAGQPSISQTLTNPSTATGTATYTVTPTSGATGSCIGSTFQVIVTVHPIPKLNSTLAPAAICSGTFNYTATSATTFCAGGSVTLNGNNNGGTWSTGQTTPSLNVTQPGTYSVSVTNSCGTSTSNSITVTVNSAPTASTITNNAGVLTASTAANYQWLINNDPIQGATTSTFTPEVDADYSVRLTSGGCSAASQPISIDVINT